MNTPRLLSSLVILACYFPAFVIALGISQTVGPRRFRSVDCKSGHIAAASDCRALVHGLRNTTSLNYGRECTCHTLRNSSDAYNPICRHDGHCCIYTDQVNTPPEVLKEFGEVILNACADDLSDKISGVARDMDGKKFCLADRGGCSNCFA